MVDPYGHESVTSNSPNSNRVVKSLSVFFPCYNEQENVTRTVQQALEVLNKLELDFEIIIVNDGSSDKTGQIAEELSSRDKRIKAVQHPKNLGYGAALQSGFRAASKEFVFYTDGDGQFDLKEMPPLLQDKSPGPSD
jgi:glycosyltransferase involved in cell wall biosynthesis